ncbi:hypothetical protein [Roseococcus sp.]|uniref:hypothetical protein n=1 Tax=Roseococcus sp. TaxID=2109646 RepID=UPI003BAD6370
MTSSLPDRVRDLRRRLKQVQDLGDKVREAGRINDLRAELAAPIAALKQQLEQRAILQGAGLTASLPVSLEPRRGRTAVLLERFRADRSAATLKKGRSWTQLLADVDEAAREVGKVLDTAWLAYKEDQFSGDKPADVRNRLAMTRENADAFKTYEDLYKRFGAFSVRPRDAAALADAKTLARGLRAAATRFDFDVPPDVKAFLDAVQEGGAPLLLLTEPVKDWLLANNALQNYRIRAVAA